jgi:hypothetical protein
MKLSAVLAALMLAAAMALAACGDDDDDDGGGGDQAEAPAKLTIRATANSIEVPATAAPGVTEITFRNDGKKDATGQLLLVEGDRSEQEVLKTFNSVSEGDKIPDWIIGGGGVGTTKPGKSTVVTQELEEGRYFVLNDADSPVTKKGYAAFEVSGERAGAELPAGSTVTASEYKFESDVITAGEPIVFENVGAEVHHLIAFPVLPGKTIAEAEKFVKTEKGEPAVDFEASVGTAVIDRDQTLVTDLGLKKGKYLFACFVSDRAGGKSHFEKGMVSGATVE